MIAPGPLEVRVGDWLQRVRVEPTLRPKPPRSWPTSPCPSIWERPEAIRKDVRGGSVTLVKGSEASFAVTASRDLASARVDGQGLTPAGATVASPRLVVDGSRNLEFQWKDQYGLEGKAPFTLAVNSRDDEPPTVSCENMPKAKVILDTELLAFKVHVQDDFGIKRVGLEWHGVENPLVSTPAKGEQILAAGERQGEPRPQRHLHRQDPGDRAAADQPPGVRRRLLARADAGLFANLYFLRVERRAARDLDCRATEQVAPAVARGA